MSTEAPPRVPFVQVLRESEFRALFVAGVLSMLGDNLARIAIALLIYGRTHSAFLTAFSFGLSLLAFLIGGPLLSTAADRWPRRGVMIVCDGARTMLVALVAIPHMPVAMLLVLMGAVALLEPPFRSARTAIWPQIVGEGASYASTINLWGMAQTLCILLGYAAGGAAVQFLGARTAILVDAATFALSALVTRFRILSRPTPTMARPRFVRSLREGGRFVFGDPWLLWLVSSSSLVMAALIAAEAMAVPIANGVQADKTVAGLLTAAPVTGTFLGILLIGRLAKPGTADRLMLPLALLTPAVLALSAFRPGIGFQLVIYLACGVGASMSTTANRVFMVAMPDSMRGRAVGLANALVSGLQGLATIAVGAIGDHLAPASALAIIAMTSLAVLVVLSFWTLFGRRAPTASLGETRIEPNGLSTPPKMPMPPGNRRDSSEGRTGG